MNNNFKHSPFGLINYIVYVGDNCAIIENWNDKKEKLYKILNDYALYKAPEDDFIKFWKKISLFCKTNFKQNNNSNYEIYKIYNKYLQLYIENNNKFTNENIVVCV